MSFADNELNIIRWAESRQIIGKASPEVQALKTVSELGELCDEIIAGNRQKIQMEYGDVMVCMVILAAMLDINVDECMGMAYEKISARKGVSMANGLFVKSD